MTEIFAGAFHTRPIYSGIAAVTQILLRTKYFVDRLKKAYESAPKFHLLAIFVDLNAQIQEIPADMDINPLIHQHGLLESGSVPVGEYLNECLQLLDRALPSRPYKEIFTCDNHEYTIQVNPGQSVTEAYSISKCRKGKIVFFEGKSLQFDRLVGSYSLYAVVCQTDFGYHLYLRDKNGWLLITDECVLAVDDYARSDACLVAYIDDQNMVITHRQSPSDTVESQPISLPSSSKTTPTSDNYVFVVHTFDSCRMAMNTVTSTFQTKKECMKELESTVATCHECLEKVYFRADSGKLTKTKPLEFVSKIELFIDLARSHSLIPSFLACQNPVMLEFRCRNCEQLRMNAVFAPNQPASDVYGFCKRILDDVLFIDSSRMRVFCTSDVESVEICDWSVRMSVSDIVNSQSIVEFSIGDTGIGTSSPERHSKSNSMPGVNSSDVLTVKIIETWGGKMEEKTFTIPWTPSLTKNDIIESAKKWSTSAHFELYRVSADGLTLEKTNRVHNDLYLYGIDPYTRCVDLAIMRQNAKSFAPTGIVYRMSCGVLVFPDRLKGDIEKFLSCKVSAFGIVQKDGKDVSTRNVCVEPNQIKYIWAVKQT